jgi:hypothetical protein
MRLFYVEIPAVGRVAPFDLVFRVFGSFTFPKTIPRSVLFSTVHDTRIAYIASLCLSHTNKALYGARDEQQGLYIVVRPQRESCGMESFEKKQIMRDIWAFR